MTGEGVLKQVLKEFSSLVEDELKQWSLPEKPVDLYSPVRYMFSLGGKRMRPTLVLLGCRLFRDDVRPAIGPALAVEVFHNFTLLHDDIMDNAPLRRGKPTVHCKWSPNVAILSGDAMMVLAYEALARTEPTVLPKLLPVFNATALEICEGQQFDMDFEQRDDVTIAEYEEMIRLKTAVLLAASLKMGALVGGASAEQAQYLYDFGLNAGIAFQLQDDILDVFGDTGKVGKQQGGDIISDKKTYLLLKAIETAQHADSEELHRWIGNSSDLPEDKVRAVTAIYDRLGIRQLAEQRMWHFHAAAQQHLDMVNGDTRWTAILREFTDSLMHREH
jgi:geranylgeranyl diphosphate synthase, type II